VNNYLPHLEAGKELKNNKEFKFECKSMISACALIKLYLDPKNIPLDVVLNIVM